jgi:hypothetical protein
VTARSHRAWGRVRIDHRGLGCGNIELVFQFADQLLEHIFHADDARRRTKFVDHYGKMPFPLLKLAQQVEQRFRFGHHQNIVHDLADFHVSNSLGGRLRNLAETKAESRPAHQAFRICDIHGPG